MADESVRKSFNSAASTYDLNAVIQRTVAEDLLKFCPPQAENTLEAGCGTGVFTSFLAAHYPSATITAVDFSEDMLKIAAASVPVDRVCFLHADLRADIDGTFDLIASNAALQWVPNLNEALARLRAGLAPRGSFVFSYFGPETYRELRESLERVLGQAVQLPSTAFASPGMLRESLSRYFTSPQVETVNYTQTFPSLRALLANVKATGTRGSGPSPKIAWTPGLLRRVEADYRAAHGDIVVTYQVSFCIANQFVNA